MISDMQWRSQNLWIGGGGLEVIDRIRSSQTPTGRQDNGTLGGVKVGVENPISKNNLLVIPWQIHLLPLTNGKLSNWQIYNYHFSYWLN